MKIFDFFKKISFEMQINAFLNKLLERCKTKEDVLKSQIKFLNFINKLEKEEKITKKEKEMIINKSNELFNIKSFEL